MTVYLLMILYWGAPSLMVQAAYTSYAQCEAVAEPMNTERAAAVCQSVRVAP